MTSRADRAGGSVSVILKKYIFFEFLNIILDINFYMDILFRKEKIIYFNILFFQ